MTILLRDLGFEVVEVREVMSQEAPDEAVAAYGAAQRMIVVTHDPGCARKAKEAGALCLWLRTREIQDRDRIREAMPMLLTYFDLGARRVRLFIEVIRLD